MGQCACLDAAPRRAEAHRRQWRGGVGRISEKSCVLAWGRIYRCVSLLAKGTSVWGRSNWPSSLEHGGGEVAAWREPRQSPERRGARPSGPGTCRVRAGPAGVVRGETGVVLSDPGAVLLFPCAGGVRSGERAVLCACVASGRVRRGAWHASTAPAGMPSG